MTPAWRESASAFPPVSAALVDATAAPREAAAFLAAFERWRPAAAGWLRDAARRGAVSAGLDTLLRWTLGYPADAAPVSGRYALGQVPDPAGPGTEAVQVILVWRSGVVDYLADVWDTIGAAEFEPGECTLAIDEVFTPAVLRGILHCPDCLQLLTDAPGSAQPHPLRCPVRLRRLLS